MVIAFVFALAAAAVLTGRLFDKFNYERAFYTLISSFIIVFISGVLLGFINQIGPIQLVVFNALILAAVLLRSGTLRLPKPEFDIMDCIAVAVFLLGFIVRVGPIISDPMPFGSYDLIQHYAMSMETFERGGVPDEFPKYMNWYGVAQDNVDGVWIYPPGNAIMMAALKNIFGFGWPLTIHLFSALFDSLSILVVYMIGASVIKSKGAGIIAGLLFAVSSKNLFSLYFGQLAYEFGIMLASFAMLVFLSGHHNRKYFVVLSGVAGGLSFVTSPLAAGYFLFASLAVSLSGLAKSKSMSSIKEFAAMMAIVALVSLFFIPKFVMWFSFFGTQPRGSPDNFSLAEFVWPFKMIEKQPGLPGWYFDPAVTMGAPWLAGIVIGIAILVFIRFENRGAIAAWLVADYILTHSYMAWGPLGFGILYDYSGRWMAQSMVVMALVGGLAGLFAVKIKDGKILLSRGEGLPLAYIVIIILALFYAPGKLDTAFSIYSQPYRMTPEMFSLLGDIRADTKEGSAMLVLSPNLQVADERRGLIEAFTKTRVYTQPTVNNGTLSLVFTHKYNNGSIDYATRYIMFDYSGFAKSQQFADFAGNIKAAESALFGDSAPAYYNKGVRVYRTA